MKMKHNFNFYITSYILCCLSLVACPSPLSDTSESVPPQPMRRQNVTKAVKAMKSVIWANALHPADNWANPVLKTFRVAMKVFA